MKIYKTGDIISGKVTGIENYGIFISLEDGVTGLIHISEISESYVRNISDYAEVGDIIRARILDFDKDKRKLKLSIKDIQYQDDIKKNQKIKETKNGFNTLKMKLNEWIDTKEKEHHKYIPPKNHPWRKNMMLKK